MFIYLAYFIVLLATCSCETDTPTDPSEPVNISGIFYRYFTKEVTTFVDIPLKKGVNLLNEITFDKFTSTIFYVEGWKDNAFSPGSQAVMKAYLKHRHTNKLIVDWSSINTDPNYFSVVAQVEKVGAAFGKQLCELFAAGLDPNKTELIGFSLGAQIVGQAGSTVQKLCKHVVFRIVALDDGAWLFYLPLPIYRSLDANDAQQTIAIHTSGLQLGVYERIAKADFYVNGGTPIQPGCDIESWFTDCNHIRSWQVFAESISRRKAFRAARADSYIEFASQSCEENAKEHIYMGDATSQELKGTFYLTTNGTSPYGKGYEGLCV